MWNVMLRRRPLPSVFMWGGDNVYADKWVSFWQGDVPRPTVEHKAMYDIQQQEPAYRNFSQQVPVVGTWDDHDFGIDGGDKSWPQKESRKQLHLDFLGVPRNSTRRRRDGVYASHLLLGPNRTSVKLLLLDIRSQRDPWPEYDASITAETGDMLGEEQWIWLEDELSSSPADMHLIMSGIQVHNYAFGSSLAETWQRFPTSRRRLVNLVSDRPR